MILIALLGLVLLGAAAGLLLRAALAPRLRAAENLEMIDAYGFTGRDRPGLPGAGAARALFDEVADVVGRLATRQLRSGREERDPDSGEYDA